MDLAVVIYKQHFKNAKELDVCLFVCLAGLDVGFRADEMTE